MIPFREAFLFWLRLGFISFGGPAAQIAIMREELVERRRWITPGQFSHALNYCMILPGPEATQLAIYLGWLMHKTRGGIVAGTLFVLPSAILLWAMSWAYVTFGDSHWASGILYGLKAAILAIVIHAFIRIGKTAAATPFLCAMAAVAFCLIWFVKVPFPIIILGAAAAGYFADRFSPKLLRKKIAEEIPADEAASLNGNTSLLRTLKVGVVWLALWWLPVLVAGLWKGWDGVLFRVGMFFSKASLVTFGGAYAVLPYVGQQAVEVYQWLDVRQMMDGFGLAETTPGPLIIVLQHFGFLGGWKFHGNLPRPSMATLAAMMTTWTTFVPCFLWVFAGAPYAEKLRRWKPLNAALLAVTAAVAGVILNLATWFGVNVLWTPASGALDRCALIIVLVAFIGLWKYKWPVYWIVGGGALAGMVIKMAGVI